jgi:hypothetical protein
MLEKPHIRRLAGMTAFFLGLAAVFASLTLVAISKPALAAVFAISGVVLSLSGLRWLPRGTP